MVQKKGKTLYERVATSTHGFDKPKIKSAKYLSAGCNMSTKKTLEKVNSKRLLKNILMRGYFPKELPPCFKTESFAKVVVDDSKRPAIFDEGNTVAHLCIHNLARAGSLRRKLSIVNPITFYPLAKCIADNWTDLERKCRDSYLSKSYPTIDQSTKRAIIPCNVESDLTEGKSITRAPQYFILKADISNFYPSIYTHSIPWALHGKTLAKRKRKRNQLLGNEIDTLVRNCQDGQTIGIPIGPDISLVIAEVILSSIDDKIADTKSKPKGIRYYDDYEFSIESMSCGNELLNILQEFLNEYELALNPNKTILKKLPHENEPQWVHAIRTFEFRKGHGQKADIIRFFDELFELVMKYPSQHVVKYALARFYKDNMKSLHEKNWSLLESLIIQACMSEPGGLSGAFRIFLEQEKSGRTINNDLIRTMLINKIVLNATTGYSSEVAWALWGALALNIKLDVPSMSCITTLNDSLVALLALDAYDRGFIKLRKKDFSFWQQNMEGDGLYDSQWLLAYEACNKGWMHKKINNYLTKDPVFGFLHGENVSFYEPVSQNPLDSLMSVDRSSSQADLYPKISALHKRVRFNR